MAESPRRSSANSASSGPPPAATASPHPAQPRRAPPPWSAGGVPRAGRGASARPATAPPALAQEPAAWLGADGGALPAHRGEPIVSGLAKVVLGVGQDVADGAADLGRAAQEPRVVVV